MDNGEPTDAIVRRFVVCFVHPRAEVHGSVVLDLKHPADNAGHVPGIAAGVVGAAAAAGRPERSAQG